VVRGAISVVLTPASPARALPDNPNAGSKPTVKAKDSHLSEKFVSSVLSCLAEYGRLASAQLRATLSETIPFFGS
jgi:hypothetical protein